jgi:hypothetical protein
MRRIALVGLAIVLMLSACGVGESEDMETATPAPGETATMTLAPTSIPEDKTTYLLTLTPSFFYYVYATREIGMIGGTPLSAHGNNYPSGILAHAPSTQVYELEGKYDRFISELVFSDNPNLNTRCGDGAYFAIILDGEVLYLSPFVNYESEPISVDVDVSGGNILRLDTYGTPDITANNECDWTFWGDPYLISYSATQVNYPIPTKTPIVSVPLNSSVSDFYVSPNGEDNNPGTLEKPFATIQHAQDIVRLINQNMKSDINVYLRGGTYFLSESLSFTSEDSGSNGYNINYKAYQKEIPVINGGLEISGFEPVLNQPYWKVHLPDGVELFRNLYINGNRAIRAQTEKPIAGIGWINGDISDTDGILVATKGPGWWVSEWGDTETIMKPEDLPTFSNPKDLELHWILDWVDIRTRVSSVEQLENNQIGIMMQQPFFSWARGIQEGQNLRWVPRWDVPFFIENAIELLDQPGEWYYDKVTYDLYYYPKPGETPQGTIATIPQLEQLVLVTGRIDTEAHNIVFSGLTFSYNSWMRASFYGTASRQAQILQDGVGGYNDETFTTYTPAAIQMEHVKNIHFTRNIFEHIGSVGIGLNNDVQDVQIIGNVFQDISDSAITLSQGTRHAYIIKPGEAAISNTLIQNNVIYKTSVEYWGAPAITAYFVDHLNITHNLIKEINYSGISVGWGHAGSPDSTTSHDNIIQNNRVERIALSGVNGNPEFRGDAGGIYTLGQQPGTRIEGNYIKDVIHNQPCYYLDEGSAFISLNNNVCDNAGIWVSIWNPNIHDNYIMDTYTNVRDLSNNGINIQITNTVFVTGQEWTTEATNIINNAGLEPEFKHLLNYIIH